MNQPRNPTQVTILPTATVLKHSTLNTGIRSERALLMNPNLWHKVIVLNADSYTRDYILKTILDDVHPLELIPMNYAMEGKHATFFARNCKMAIEKLCRQQLLIPNPLHNDKPLKLNIVLGYSNKTALHLNMQNNVMQVLQKRHSSATKTLNLDNFCKDPDLSEYCSLSQPKIFFFVLHLAKTLQIQNLRLSNNDIRILSPLECLWGMKTLTMIDLRNNSISNMNELCRILKTMHITDLLLDGNPICQYYDEFTYVQAIKEVCPKIEKLDSILLSQSGFPALRRNYVVNVDGQELVDQFLEHYFTLYDSNNRSALGSVYDKDALFSLSCQYISGQFSTSFACLGCYKMVSRNLKLLSDLARSEENLYKGNDKIGRLLSNLPPTEHDPYTFTVDLVYYSEEAAVVTVTGVFREPAETLLDTERILGFMRTFVLAARSNGEYNVINEMYHISNATTVQQQRAFKVVRVPRPTHITIEPPRTTKEKNEMAQALGKITNLNNDWCKKCLDECSYDLRKSLLLFVALHKVDKIPQTGFLAESKK